MNLDNNINNNTYNIMEKENINRGNLNIELKNKTSSNLKNFIVNVNNNGKFVIQSLSVN